MYVDPDAADPKLLQELISYYEDSGKRLRQIVLHPTGKTQTAVELNQARAAQQLQQVQAEIDRLKKQATAWTGKALPQALSKGLSRGNQQLVEAGLKPDGNVSGSLNLLDRHSVQVLAKDTASDLLKAADSMKINAQNVLRRMAATGVSNQDVNKILAGGVIEGKPVEAIRQLRVELEKVHGDQVTIPTRSGGTRTYDTGYYAEMVGRSKMREATVVGRHERLKDAGIDLVKIVGRNSKNPCSLLLGHVFSLSGRSQQHPAFSSVSHGQEPYRLFHPNCTKSTTPFVEGLSSLGFATGRGNRGEVAA